MRADSPSEPAAPKIVVVMPAYRSAPKIGAVLDRIPSWVAHVVVVDDASPDNLATVVRAHPDARLELVAHSANRGVGAAMKTGIARALELGADILVKLDSDGQMDPALLADFVGPIASGEADFTKGHRFSDLDRIRAMPLLRRVGNLGLSFLVKLASGYWSVFDPTNGYLALAAPLARRLRPARLADRYFFEISLLCEAYLCRAVLRDVPMDPVYADETSSLSPLRTFFEFLPRLFGRVLTRVGYAYFLRDFNLVSLFLLSGLPMLSFGLAWSGYYWYLSIVTDVAAHTGTIVIGLLAIILGFQLLLQALVLDVQNEPRKGQRP